MPEASVKSPERPKLMIRRGKKVIEGVEVQTVFADIKAGQLKPSNEFSMDGANWRRLDSHPQLAKVFASAPKPKTKSKGPLVFLFLVILAVFAGVYFHPYLAFYNVQTAVDSQNTQKLSQWVDYSGLQQDVKSQLDAQWGEVSATKIDNTPYAKSAGLVGRAQVDKMTNALVTPEAVMGFARGETGLIGSWARESSKAPAVGDKGPSANLGFNMDSVSQVLDSVKGVLAQGEFRYAGLNSFVATIKTIDGESLDFRYERKGIDWKLSGITLPSGRVRSSFDGIAQSALKKVRSQTRGVSKGKKDKGKESNKEKAQVAKLVSDKKAYMANLEIRSLTVGKGKKYLFNSPNPGLFATLMNNGNRTLNEVQITVYFYNDKGAIVSEKKLYPVSVSKYRTGRDNDPLKPQTAKKVGYLVKEFAPSSWAGKVQMRVTDIIFKE
jgi:hypothetical protein